LLGHSIGGLLAQLVAARIRYEQLILLSSAAPEVINPWSCSVLKNLGRNLLRFPLRLRVTAIALSNIRYGIAHTQSDEIQANILRLATYESGRAGLQIGMGSFLVNSPTHVHVENIECPILVVGGTEDRITPIRNQREIAGKFLQKAALVEIQGACHWAVGGRFFPQIQDCIFDLMKLNNER